MIRIAITVVYALIVAVLLPSAWHWLIRPTANIFGASFISGLFRDLGSIYRLWLFWVWAGILLSGQATLLLLSADTPWRQAKPRSHQAGIVSTIALLASLLTTAGFGSFVYLMLWSLLAAGYSDKFVEAVLWPLLVISPMDWTPDTYFNHVAWWIALWLIWGAVLYIYVRRSAIDLAAAVSWLFKSGGLALLVAASAHVAVSGCAFLEGLFPTAYRKPLDWLFANAFTAFYIVTAIGVMLLSFGPVILTLSKKRLDDYSKPPRVAS